MSRAPGLRWHPPLLWLALGLLLLLGWEVAGLDLPVSAWAGGQAGFPLRRAGSWASRLHDGGRWVSGLLLAALWVDALWPGAPWRQPAGRSAQARFDRRWVALSTVLVLLAVPALKRASATSCPWDLAAFGGQVPYVPHWLLAVVDGGPGHCFPSGHAVGALAFLVPVVAWWRHAATRAPAWGRDAAWAGLAVALAGTAFGMVQVLRGAHHASHVLWSAWLCAAWAVASDAACRAWWQAKLQRQHACAAAQLTLPAAAPDRPPVALG